MDRVEAEEGRPYDAVMLLEPSSPFATAEHLDRAVEIYAEQAASLVIGLRPVTVASRFIGPLRADGRADRIVSKFAGGGALRRQEVEPEYTMNGALYLVDWASMRRTGRIYGDPERTWGLVMDEAHSCDVETPLDLAFARYLVDSGVLDTSPWRP
jgi:CMP-N-acetylneuraminic acid synthetase